ncbi:MAG: hypothetical protein PVH61_07955 [Candidatus Aminicenantes bacterium]|jgi:hypothetical protein
MSSSNKKLLRGGLNQWVSGSVGQFDDRQVQLGNPLIMMPHPHPETNERQHQRVAQHIGTPRRGAPGRRRQKSCILLLLLFILLIIPFSFAQTDDFEHYLLMQEIPKAFKNVMQFKSISEAKISVNLDSPFKLHGYFPIDKFVDDFTLRYSEFALLDIEWVSRQLEEQFAVQSLVLILKNERSEKTVYYKLIFFLAKKDKEWKIFYLRGLKI